MDTTKIIQALNYLACHQSDRQLDNMKAYKLLWLADRYHLRQTGRTITGDSYYAMPFGIVPSDAKCILENAKTKLKNPDGYKDKYIKSIENHQFKSVCDPDLNVFSESDQNALDKVLNLYGNYRNQTIVFTFEEIPKVFFVFIELSKKQMNMTSNKLQSTWKNFIKIFT